MSKIDNRLCKCNWCDKETVKVYQLRDRSYLCLECAITHYNSVNTQMENHIKTIRVGLDKKRVKLLKFKEMECKHENAIDTKYCVGIGDSLRNIWRCPDCGKTIYKKYGGIMNEQNVFS